MANKSVHVINRICCVCRKLQPVTAMKRVVRINGNFYVQTDQRLNGRGAHVCPNCLCSSNLQKSLNRSFKTELPAKIFQQLTEK